MDDDVRRAGAVYDVARPGALLRRARASKKCAVRAGAMSRHSWAGHHTLVGCRLLPRFFARVSLYRGFKVFIFARRRFVSELSLFLLGLTECFRDVSTDFRHHYAGFN